jgi:hypothetical protein
VHIVEEAAAPLVDHRLVQRLQRADAREHTALGQLDPIRHRLQREGRQTVATGDLHRRAENRGAGEFGFLGLGFHGPRA